MANGEYASDSAKVSNLTVGIMCCQAEENGGDHEQKKRVEVEKSTKQQLSSWNNNNNNNNNIPFWPSALLNACLKAVQDTMRADKSSSFERGSRLFYDPWGLEYWRCYASGRPHVLETSGCATMEQIAWIASTALDSMTQKELDGGSFTDVYLLFIVPSQEKVAQVCAVFNPLKAFGANFLSLQPGASTNQKWWYRLKRYDPEFLICTPDRLVELLSMDAVDISGVRSLIIDGLEYSSGDAYIDSIKSIQQHISVDPHTLVCCSGFTPAVWSLLPTPMCTLSQEAISNDESAP